MSSSAVKGLFTTVMFTTVMFVRYQYDRPIFPPVIRFDHLSHILQYVVS